MYTEIIKIIEGGLSRDIKKVSSYAKLLAENANKNGDLKLAEKINRVLKNVKSQPVYLDQLLTVPVDQETRMNIVDFILPSEINIPVVLAPQLEKSISDFIKTSIHRNKLVEAGLDVNVSLLLYGPPGSGKTTIAKHISKQLDLPLVVARFDSLISSLLGNTAKNIRKVFEFASRQPCILFLDEFDAIAKARDDQYELGELKRVINSLLQNIDEFTTHSILIAATNHHELLDKAIWRRFNKVLEINYPSKLELINLLQLYTENSNSNFLDDPKRLEKILDLFLGLSPANIKSIIQNSIGQNIIVGKQDLTFEDLLIQLFIFKHHGAYTQDELIRYLSEQGVSQNIIKDLFNISMRQVRNILN